MADAAPKVLFLANCDFGLSNVVLAAAYAILHAAPHVEVHIAAFQPLKNAVAKTYDYCLNTAPEGSKPKPIVFHTIEGTSWGPHAFDPQTGVMDTYNLTPGLINTARTVLVLPTITCPWPAEEFVSIYQQVSQIFAEVKPAVTVVEPLFAPGLTLCHHLRTNWIVLTPNTVKDFALLSQPGLAMLWKYPFVGSGLPYPVPWSYIPRNIFFGFVGAYAVLTSTRIAEATALLHSKVDKTITVLTASNLGVLTQPPPGLQLLVSSRPDLDLPLSTIPSWITSCGPILCATPSIESVDPELAAWLRQGPTVFINLGTLLKATPKQAVEMALAFRDMLNRAEEVGYGQGRKLQILWKLARQAAPGEKIKAGEYPGPWKEVCDILSPEIEQNRVRITDWVTAEPKAVLETGQVVCSVHHGGASSFYEAICAGIPHVILPPWADCYDFGNRVEILQVGRWGNQAAKPRWERGELGSCLDDVLFGPRAGDMIAKAKDIASRFDESTGRNMVAREILNLLP